MIGTAEIAKRLHVTPERVRALIKSGRLPSAQKLGRDWFVDERDLALVKNRKPGRPRKLAKVKGKK
jgi:excisionase family DNA binding protein